jgi:hypothetical protein
MRTQSRTLAEALPEEIARVRELLGHYKELGPVGSFGAAMIECALRRADDATTQQDTVAMLRSLYELQEFE